MKRISEYTNITTVAENDVVPIVDVSDTEQASTGSTKKGTIETIADYLKDRNMVEVLKKVYPVGCIYTSTVSTNPSILFGFGTWSAFGAGKVMVGLDSTDADFDTAEETGGAKTHTLTINEMPSHTHQKANAWGTAAYISAFPDVWQYTSEKKISGVDIRTGATGGGGSHNNLQPYIVTYFWKRES